MERILVTGAGGFIGTHLVRKLKQQSHWVRGVDLKRPQWSESEADEFWLLDLRDYHNALMSCQGIDRVYHLAADMGGMLWISTKQADIIANNTAINVNTIRAARNAGIERFLFSSSACIYPISKQSADHSAALRESDACPAQPQQSYGWEKLHMEHLCTEYREAGWLDTHIVRFHNCYGIEGAWRGGREKAPAALCRKVAVAKLAGYSRVEIWGDGTQVRSYMFIDDCIGGLLRLMQSDFYRPINMGRSRTVTVDRLADIIADIADIEIEKVHVPGPAGVHWRNSDNSLCKQVLDWEPTTPIEQGLVSTYQWIEELVRNDPRR